MASQQNLDRRQFVKTLSTAGAGLGLAGSSLFAARPAARTGRVLGANDMISVGVIGAGGRGSYVAQRFARIGGADKSCKITAVCDVYTKRKNAAAQRHQCDSYIDYREIVNRDDIDAVIVATPDHWHAKIALEAMEQGKDVYLEKPMCHTIPEAKQLVDAVSRTKRVLQVGSQTTSGGQWMAARKVIADGMIGDMIMSQGSYHRNSNEGEWNWPIDANASPDAKGDDFIDWKTWLGPAQNRPWDADRFFRFRKYWDYSGGIATDLFYHVVAPMNICWGEPQFPAKVTAGGGKYVFKNDREVPDTFFLIGEYAKGHAINLTSSMGNSQHIPGLIRGHLGSVIMVEHGRFEGDTNYITVRPERRVLPAEYKAKWGEQEIKIPVTEVNTMDMAMDAHVRDFLSCIRTRQKPRLDVETGARAQVLISMAVQAYREGRVLYFDEKTWKVSGKAPKA